MLLQEFSWRYLKYSTCPCFALLMHVCICSYTAVNATCFSNPFIYLCIVLMYGAGVSGIEFIIDTFCSKYIEHMYHTEMCIVPTDHLHRYHILFQT
jgi:hypothetical protein